MKASLSILFVLALGGCVSPGPSFSWFHPEGGEYLFAYDKDECTHEGAASTDLADTSGPFFSCMHQRGYYLVDASGEILAAPTALVEPVGPQIGAQ